MERINKSVIESFTSKFRTLGLSTYAAKTYLALLSRPGISASFLCNETSIPDSKMYYALNELSIKGMIITQKGTPNIYKPIHPKDAINNLKQLLMEDLNQKIRQAETMADFLSPIFENAESKEEIELAYVIRGRRNIVKKMRDLISSAKNETVVFISEKDLLDELNSSIREVRNRIEVKLAVTRKLLKTTKLKELSQARILTCACNMVISDMRTLITVSSWRGEIAIMTNDRGLMTMCREYYENPKCCEE